MQKSGSVLISRAIKEKRLRWLRHILKMKDDRLPKVVLFGQPSRAKRIPKWMEDVIRKDLRETITSWEGVKREGLNRLGWREREQLC